MVSPLNACKNSTVALSATSTAGNTLVWYTFSSGGLGSLIAPVVSTATTGTFTYYVSQRNSTLVEGPRAAIIVTVKAIPSAPIVSSPIFYCLDATSTILNATADSSNNLLWYNVATGGTASVNIPTTVTSITGNTTYYVSQTNNVCPESPRAAINVNIIAPPTVGNISAAPYTKLFPGLNTSIAVANGPAAGNTYAWYRNGILVTGQTGNNVTANIDGLGNYTLKVTNANGCVGTSNVVSISDSTQQKMFIYPNPSTGKFQVRYLSDNNNSSPRKITIFNSAGSKVYSASFVMFGGYTAMNIDLTSVATGIYYIHLMDNDGKQLATERIFIRR